MNIDQYPTSAVTECFPWRSNAVIQDWLNKGLIRAYHASSGPGDYHMFTSHQIVHIGVVDQLSMLGVFRDLDKREDHVGFDIGDKNKSKIILSSHKSPADAESYYKENGFDVLITVSVRWNLKVSGSGRTKRQSFFYQIVYRKWLWRPKPNKQKSDEKWHGMKDALQYWDDRLRYDPHPLGLIAVRPIWKHVRRTLAIGYKHRLF